MSNVDWVNAGGGGAVVSPAVLRPAETAAERKMERRPAMAFVALSVFYFAVVAILSSFKLLWLDELITLHLARLGGASAIWQALAQGADPNPPLTYLLVHWCRAAFGDHEFVYRLPAIVGYWMGTLSLFLYLKRRLPATWALGGAMLSMTMGAFEYSYESRSYGIFYGLAMLAFLGWSRTVDARSSGNVRRFALLGMIVALGAGISTNYFAVLAFFPIAAGELARTFARARAIPHLFLVRDKAHRFRLLRSIDLRIWIGLAVAGSTLLIYRSLISHAIAQFGPYAWNKVSLDQVTDSYTQMVEVVLYPILALFVLGIGVYFMAPPAPARS